MEFRLDIIAFLFVLIALIISHNTAQSQTTVQEVSFTYDNIEFGFFQTSPIINQSSAQTQCMHWGGNLATIKSAVEDSLLFYSSPDIGTVFTCYIGLNEIVGGKFEWIDGSMSSYRNWGTVGEAYPLTNTNYDCVRNRYRFGGTELSQGWLNIPCYQTRNCYICSKSGMSNGCDFIYNSSCYKVFEVSTPINWLDAQSGCSIWGGDLTSITTERENNYLNTMITSSVSNCWIGLNDRDVEGTYTWIDGTILDYSNWTSTPPRDSNSNCVQINNTGNGIWESVSCEMTLNAFLCKRSTASIVPTGDPNIQLTYDDTLFGYFTNSPAIDWNTAQHICLGWGGNLATIKSKEEDSLLYYSTTDIQTHFSCFIGLNDILNEAGTDESVYTWVDGSSSDYRNFGTGFPKNVTDRDCVRFRYKMTGGVLSEGWINQVSSIKINCHFCSKPATSADCDLIHDGSCYRVFEVSIPINWLDAQSSCAIWGGDLTSITTERENSYLYTIIPDTVSNCWIGLNDRDAEGTYAWTDGTAISYTNWTSTPPNIANSDCVQINNAGCGMWEFMSCEMTLNAFLCKRDSSSNVLTGSRFGRITNGGLKFEDLVGNRFFYESQTLVCGGDGSSVVWRYSQNSDLSDAMVISETSNYVDFSWLDANTTMQGYYQCMISHSVSYTVGVYNITLTTVSETGANYTYIVGVDRIDVLLLCDPEDGGSLGMLWWSEQGGMGFLNPINLYSESNYLPDVLTSFSCRRGGDTLNTTQICVKVPTISISYGVVPVTNYSSLYPVMNTLSVPSAVQDITLSINIDGKWNLADITNTTNSILTIPNFSSQNNGVYKFYTDNWDVLEVCVIQIELTSTNIISGDSDTQLIYDNTLFGYFSNSPSIDWYTAQLRCQDWGGNLTTIKSKEEDSLLYYSSTNIQTHFACYIGLNDILNEAGTDGNVYTWVDGSSSDYRNFETGFPASGVERDCVRFRYETGTDVVSDGWNNQVCSKLVNCHFCSKPATSGDCDLIYNSSCYRVFEVSTPINWLDAQSSCAIWGGDLTSITTERENSYLYTIIPDTMSNCWIGLNDRDVEGTYTWIDGTTYNKPNFVSTLSNIGADDCVRITNSGDWESVSCLSTLSSFVCKASSLIVIATVQIFGELTDEGLNFQTINENTFLFNSLTLACGGEESTTISWKYSQISDFSTSEELTATSSSVETGLSWLKVDNSKQGYYQCQINNGIRYTIGVYDQTSTTVAVLGTTHNYTVGIDGVDASLLCNPNNDDILLVSLMWGIKNGDANDVGEVYTHEFLNPADLNTVFSNVGGGLQTFNCFYRMSPITLLGSLQLALKDTATITINYQGSTTTFSDANNPMFPSAQEIDIPVGTTDIELTCNLPECVWKISNEASVITTETYIIAAISKSYNADISLMRMTNTGVNYTTAHVHILAQDITESASGIALVAAVIIVLGLLICLVTMAILIPLIIYCCVKKRNTIRRPKPSVLTKDGFSGYENLSELPSSSKEYIDLPVNLNPQYMTIDETSMIPLKSENEQKLREYVNLGDESSYTQPNEENNETINEPSSELNPIVPYEGYVPMSSVKKEKKFVSTFIPTKEFPATYQQLVASGINKNSLFSVEFTNLTEYSKIHTELETDEAIKGENNTKNPLRNIIPFDENRVVLDSPYFGCNYINASWIESYQYIATINPTKETHRDFLQMIYQTEASMVIMLTTRREKAKIISGISNRVCYWPKKDAPINCESFESTLVTSTETNAFLKQEITLNNTSLGTKHTFIHCISPIWNEDSTVADMTPALVLLSRILKQIQEVPSKPIIIHCEDGISKTGILLSGINCVKELTHTKSINIFNSVKNLRRQRMNMVPTLACYTTCYSLMNEYCSIHL